MQNRLEGQRFFNEAITDTMAIAKDLIKKAADSHMQAEEMKLMAEAEQETIAFNRQVKELEEIEKAQNANKKKAE